MALRKTPRQVNQTEAEARAELRASVRKFATVTARELYWLPMQVNFTGSAGEIVAASTDTVDFDLLIRGIWTSLADFIRWRLFQSDSDLQYSATYSRLWSMAGRSFMAHPIYWLFRPIYLRARAQLRAEFIADQAGIAPGSVVFIAEKVGGEKKIEARCTTEYRLTVDLLNGITPATDYPLLIWGASADPTITTANNVRITDLSTGYQWSPKPVSIGALAGLQSEIQPIVRWPCPVYLPPKVQLKVEASINSGFLDFVCERILY